MVKKYVFIMKGESSKMSKMPVTRDITPHRIIMTYIFIHKSHAKLHIMIKP